MAFDSLFWWGAPAIRRDGGLARPVAPPRGSGVILPGRLNTVAQVYGMPEFLGTEAQVGVTGALPQSGNYNVNPGSPPATNVGGGNIGGRGVVGGIAGGIPGSNPRAGGGRNIGPLAISVGGALVRALGVPGVIVGVATSILNFIVGPGRVAAPVVPGTGTTVPPSRPGTGPLNTGGSAAAFDPRDPSSFDFVPGVTEPGSFGAFLGADYGNPSPADYASAPANEFDASVLAEPGPVDTPSGSADGEFNGLPF